MERKQIDYKKEEFDQKNKDELFELFGKYEINEKKIKNKNSRLLAQLLATLLAIECQDCGCELMGAEIDEVVKNGKNERIRCLYCSTIEKYGETPEAMKVIKSWPPHTRKFFIDKIVVLRERLFIHQQSLKYNL